MTAPPTRRHRFASLHLLLRALAWRSGASIAYFLVAVACVMAAAAGPIELGAADQSLVQSALERAPVTETGITLSPATGSTAPAKLLAAARSVPGGSGPRPQQRYSPVIMNVDLSASTPDPRSGLDDGINLVWRSGDCLKLRFSAGRCPASPGSVALSTRSAAELHLGVGSHIAISTRDNAYEQAYGGLVVSGLYVAGAAAGSYWWGENPFAFGASDGHAIFLDDGFMSSAGVEALKGFPMSDWAQLPLKKSHVSAAAVPGLVSSLASWAGHMSHLGLAGTTDLGAALAPAQSEESIAASVAEMVSLEIVLLALLVLYGVARRSGEARAPDVRVAELRGMARWQVVSLCLREPVALLLAAVPVGILASVLVNLPLDRDLFGSTATTRLDSLAIAAGCGAAAAGLLATLLASRSLLSRHDAIGSVSSSTRAATVTEAILDALGVGLAVAGIVSLAGERPGSSASSSPLTFLAPGLIALGLAVIACRVLPLLGQMTARVVGSTHAVAVMLAARNISRRHSLRRVVLVPSIAVSLTVVAAAGLLVASQNRTMQAGYTLGAPEVLDVHVRPGVNFEQAVRAADPSGRSAMAAVIIQASFGTTLAVDATRLAAVASWPHGIGLVSAARLARMLAPPTPPIREVASGNALVLRTNDSSLPARGPQVVVVATLYDPLVGTDDTVTFGPLRQGDHAYRASLLGDCSQGCRVDTLALDWNGGQRRSGSKISLVSLATATRGDMRVAPMLFRSRQAWTESGAGARLQSGPGKALTVLTGPSTDQSVIVSPVDRPTPVPVATTAAVLAGNTLPGEAPSVTAVGLDGSELPAKPVAVAQLLPVVGSDATMADLGVLERYLDGQPSGDTYQVWCSGPPSAKLRRALAHNGVEVVSLHGATGLAAELGQSGPGYGFDLFGLSAGVALLLAVGWIIFSVAADARERRVEMAGLEGIGMPRLILRRALLFESTAIWLVGVVAGLVGGVVGASLALRFLPEFAPGRVGPPLTTAVPVGLVAALCGVMLLLFVAVSFAADSVLVRGVRSRLLWSSQ